MTSDNSPQVTTEQNTEIQELSSDEEVKEKKPLKQSFKEAFELMLNIIKIMFKWSTIRVILAHHPYCDPFKEHTFNIGKLRLCRGCWLSYPPMYATILIYLFWPQARVFMLAEAVWIMDNLWWFVIGFGILALVGRLLGHYSRFIKDLSKFGRGAWAGFLVVVIITQHWGFKIGAGLIIIGGMTYLSLNRGKDMDRICDECEWRANYDACPGMKEINHDFAAISGDEITPPHQKQNLPIIFEKPTTPQKQYEESLSSNGDSLSD